MALRPDQPAHAPHGPQGPLTASPSRPVITFRAMPHQEPASAEGSTRGERGAGQLRRDGSGVRSPRLPELPRRTWPRRQVSCRFSRVIRCHAPRMRILQQPSQSVELGVVQVDVGTSRRSDQATQVIRPPKTAKPPRCRTGKRIRRPIRRKSDSRWPDSSFDQPR